MAEVENMIYFCGVNNWQVTIFVEKGEWANVFVAKDGVVVCQVKEEKALDYGRETMVMDLVDTVLPQIG